MSKDPAFPFYAQDFLTGVMHLTMEERGMYVTLIAYQWEHNTIPKKRLGLIVGCSWENLPEELKSKFIDKGDYIVQQRLEDERTKRKKFKEKQSINGSKGGRPKKNKNPNKTQTNTQKKPLESENEKESENEDVIEIEVYPSFEDFWDLYDKKVGKKSKIEKKWESLDQNTKEKIMGYIPNYKISKPDKQYRKNPETFLNNEGWNDELIIPNHGNTVNTINRQSEETYIQNGKGWG